MSRELVRIFMSFTSWMLGLFLLTASLPVLAVTETEAAKLLASDGAEFDMFGVSVAISDDWAVIGAYGDGDNGPGSGSAYIFERDGTATRTEVAKLLASDGAWGDGFGRSVAISGDRVVIGAYRDDDHGHDSGSAYVFERDGAGNWSEVVKLLASDGAADDDFGSSVALSGDRAVIGAYGDDDKGDSSGSAYVFSFAASPPPRPTSSRSPRPARVGSPASRWGSTAVPIVRRASTREPGCGSPPRRITASDLSAGAGPARAPASAW